MRRAVAAAAAAALALALACGGQDTRTPRADSTRALSATSREWVRSLVGSSDNSIVIPFATPEPDANYALSVEAIEHTDHVPADALKVCFLDQWDWGFAVTFCYTPGGTSEWVTYRITADGLRNGG